MIKKLTDMENLGYSRDDAIKMTKSSPAIYGFSLENMTQKLKDMENLGYSREDVIKMTKSLPTIYGLSLENIKHKIDFYREHDLDFISVSDTKKLMQSVELSYARMEFLDKRGVVIDSSNYALLFMDAKKFFLDIYGEEVLNSLNFRSDGDASYLILKL